jgi:hypothetical protein
MFSPGPPVSSTNKTEYHDITEILLKEEFGDTKGVIRILMVEVMLSGLLFHNTFQMQSSCLKDSGEVCMFDGVSGAGIAYPSGALEFTPGF